MVDIVPPPSINDVLSSIAPGRALDLESADMESANVRDHVLGELRPSPVGRQQQRRTSLVYFHVDHPLAACCCCASHSGSVIKFVSSKCQRSERQEQNHRQKATRISRETMARPCHRMTLTDHRRTSIAETFSKTMPKRCEMQRMSHMRASGRMSRCGEVLSTHSSLPLIDSADTGFCRPIMRISHARTRYIYDLFYKREAITRELYDWLLKENYADAK